MNGVRGVPDDAARPLQTLLTLVGLDAVGSGEPVMYLALFTTLCSAFGPRHNTVHAIYPTSHTHLETKVSSRTIKGSLACPTGEPSLVSESSTQNPT